MEYQFGNASVLGDTEPLSMTNVEPYPQCRMASQDHNELF